MKSSMIMSRRGLLISMLTVTSLVIATGFLFSEEKTTADRRVAAAKAMKAGNFKEAFSIYKTVTYSVDVDSKKVGHDMNQAIHCLRRLGQQNKIDEYREDVIKAHPKNWRLLQTAASSYLQGNHYGYIIAGKFERGHHRGGGRYVYSYQRDRIRSLQLMQQALPLVKKDDDKKAVAQFYLDYASSLRNHTGAWRLQYLSDLSKLPDYDNRWYYHNNSQGAPVDEKGQPVYHYQPKSYKAAKTDGQRWRWALAQAVENDPNQRHTAQSRFAGFLQSQFGVQSMQYYHHFAKQQASVDDTKKDESGTFALHTLKENETIAKLASGIKRFELPDEFNFIKIYQQIAKDAKNGYGSSALSTLSQIFENRRQYPRAAEYWRENIKRFGDSKYKNKQKRLEQIVSNWGRFEPATNQTEGKGALLQLRYRNGSKVQFTAKKINVEKLLEDVKTYIKANHKNWNWYQSNPNYVGRKVVWENMTKYVGKQVASWDLKLKPLKKHFDRRVTITTPLQEPGAYLVTAKMVDGNTSQIVLWITDTAIVKKTLSSQNLYFVADAKTGKPLAKANVEFFGYRRNHLKNGNYRISIKNFAEFTDASGQVITDNAQQPNRYNWLITARTKSGRLAYLGFHGVWYSNYRHSKLQGYKTFIMTDRPVYRPKHTVKFKAWVRKTDYAQTDKSVFANRSCLVEIRNPKGEKIYTKNHKLDEYGGVDGVLELPSDATLGSYSVRTKTRVSLFNSDTWGYGTFRVEEYKKPEFEVSIDAPKEPVKLGDKITAKIQAKYFFGAPVTEAKVKYKVYRTSYSNQWFPVCRWDWMYGSGYGWFSPDYNWYPGFASWGCKAPMPWWYHGGYEQPELILDREVQISADGTVNVEIDTTIAKAVHGNQDHQYRIVAEVVDQSRRTIVGEGKVLVARKPFKIFTWVDRGYYQTGGVINANMKAQTLDQKPVQGTGKLQLLKISYDKKRKPIETEVESWDLNTNDQGLASMKIKAAEPGQYRLSYKLTDKKKNTIEGGYLFTVTGEEFTGEKFRFNNLELIVEKQEYKPGDKIKLLINTNHANSTILLFVRPENGIYQKPQLIHIDGKSTVHEIEVTKGDMPNFFVEAMTISRCKVYSVTKEVIVPPEKRILQVSVEPSSEVYKPGQKATVKLKLTDIDGKPFIGTTVVSIYDKSVEYISGGSNVGKIKEFFWKWRRSHYPSFSSNLSRWSSNLVAKGKASMNNIGVFGATSVDEVQKSNEDQNEEELDDALEAESPAKSADTESAKSLNSNQKPGEGGFGGGKDKKSRNQRNGNFDPKEDKDTGGESQNPLVQPKVRKNFADTAYWTANLKTNSDGIAQITLDMPENLTTWKVKVWAMGHGTKVGSAETEVITRKDLIVRMQAPRFFLEKDEVLLSANVHNYLKTKKQTQVSLKLDGKELVCLSDLTQTVSIDANGEARVNWRVKVAREGVAKIQMAAMTDEESDAMAMNFPVYVHGYAKTESWTGSIARTGNKTQFSFRVPKERRAEQTRLEVRYSPTLAGAMVDALPYLIDYPYGCTEQTLNRFVPTIVTHKILKEMKLDLAAIQKKRTNLNAQEIGDDKKRSGQWKRYQRNPVFDADEANKIAKAGLIRLTNMQMPDGGWGWFSGYGGHSSPHTTAVVVHGLQTAQNADFAIVPNVLKRGVVWLTNYQNRQVTLLKNAASKTKPYKTKANNLDAMIYMVLVDAKVKNQAMMDFLYRDRINLAVYSKAMIGLAFEKQGEKEKLTMILRNIKQYLVIDNENDTAHLELPADNYWWYWYGSENEAHAFYLKLLARTNPKGKVASQLVKYILNNRKHGVRWDSTRDTAYCIEALSDYLKATGEMKPEMTVEIWLDGKKQKTVTIDSKNLFTYDNKFVLEGEKLASGVHQLEIRRKGNGPVYFSGYLTNFTLEDHITAAGLEVKVARKYYKLIADNQTIKDSGSRGQVLDKKVEKYKRVAIENLSSVKSGDLIEVELIVDSKNDYEYILLQDMKAAGLETVDVRSGYVYKDLPAYMEVRDNRVTFFVQRLMRGRHSISYRLRAEIPGQFSALPTSISAMYAPELKGNSDEMKIIVKDVEVVAKKD